MSKISIVLGVIIFLCIIVFGFIFFEPFITENEIEIRVINKERWTGKEENILFLPIRKFSLTKIIITTTRQMLMSCIPYLKEVTVTKLKLLVTIYPFYQDFGIS